MMKTKLLTIALFSLLASLSVLAKDSPAQYNYQVALFDGENLLYQDAGFTSDSSYFSYGDHISYFVKTCEKTASKTITKLSAKSVYQGIGYHIDVISETLTFFETTIDESAYTKTEKIELNSCTNTGQPQEKRYEYKIKLDLTRPDIQRYAVNNHRVVKVIIQQQK
ncbi:hypothetical protein [Vibrio sp. TRT 1302]|uniref:hypothetical protein n=1 Tax=Vibrio sp. TRT 1302 TaxID=3418504 RepID=UPI003CF0966C